MEPIKTKMKIYLGDYEVIEVRNGAVTISIGGNVTITMHLMGLPNTVKRGDKLPLLTYVPYDAEGMSNALFGGSPIE